MYIASFPAWLTDTVIYYSVHSEIKLEDASKVFKKINIMTLRGKGGEGKGG